ncbi:hypothetical protein B0A48_07252 [Cryoendolithus antarcticus]|uniref:Uncharacterized protein n=1 Tax=Cryoendolithus antarcticus TaxID=1507870 RepID=A0A1V8T827_9PEZI|nr:hypothetical protein B0A48_07252 [Cryoendolithus antarcticus]
MSSPSYNAANIPAKTAPNPTLPIPVTIAPAPALVAEAAALDAALAALVTALDADEAALEAALEADEAAEEASEDALVTSVEAAEEALSVTLAPLEVLEPCGTGVTLELADPVAEPEVEAHVAVWGKSVTPWPWHRELAKLRVAIAKVRT